MNPKNKSFSRDSVPETFILYSSALMVLATSAMGAFLVLIQGQNGEIRGFFSAQARSIMMGHFYVNESDLPSECYQFKGQCYGYFGITPSLLRIPLLIFRKDLNFTSSSLITAITLGIIASYLLLNRVASLINFWSKNVNCEGKIRYFLVLIALGPGSLFLQLARPSGQWESIAWGSTLSTFGIFCIVSWFDSKRKLYLVLALITFTLAANARITNGLIAFGAAFVCIIFRDKLSSSGDKLTVGFLSLLCCIPTLSAFLILYLKFQTFFPNLTLHEQVPEAPHWNQILSTNGGKTVGIIFILSNLVTYLRPDSFVLVNLTDLVSLRPTYFPVLNVFPLKKGGMYYEPTLSVTNVMPIFIFMTVYLFRFIDRPGVNKTKPINEALSTLRFLKGIALSCFAGLAVTLTFVVSSNRYLGDFLPGSSLVTIIGLLLLFKKKNDEKTPILFYFATFLILLGVFTNVLSAVTRARYGSL
jgi:hypothetical protein